MNKYLLSLFILILTGCGNSSSSNIENININEKHNVYGTFIDSNVEGISYICSSSPTVKTTNNEGIFTCKEDDNVSFFLSNIKLGEIVIFQDIVVTPYSFFTSNEEASINLARILQSLDIDNDPSNGITLDPTLLSLLPDSIDFNSITFENDIEKNIGDILISKLSALTHMKNSINDYVSYFGDEIFTNPEISSILSTNSLTEVSIDSSIVIIFDKEIEEETLITSSIILKDSSNNIITYSKLYDNKILTLTPNTILKYSTNYTLTLSSSITDIFSNSLEVFEYYFITKDEIDTTIPIVSSIIPGNNESDVDINSKIVITFNEAMKEDTLNLSNIILKDSDDQIISYEKSYSNNILTLTPSSFLNYSTTYNLRLTNSISDTSSNYLNGIEYNFITTEEADTISPSVDSILPTNNATGISISSPIVITFSEDIKEDTLSSSSIFLKNSNNVIVPYSKFYANKVLVLTPDSILDYNTNYTLSLSSLITDINSNALSEVEYSFKTISKPQTINTVYTTVSTIIATDVSIDAAIVITFDQDIDENTLTTSTVVLKDSDSNIISYTQSYLNKILTLTPSSSLTYDTNYTLNLSSLITNTNSNALSAVEYSFTTISQPQTINTVSTIIATGVSIDAAIVITFDQDIDENTLITSTVVIKDSDNNIISYTQSYLNKILTLTPSSSLNYDTNYTLNLTSLITDTNSNALSEVEYNFKTEADSTAPIISSITPSSESVRISPDLTSIDITFSENMDNSTLIASNFTLEERNDVKTGTEYNPTTIVGISINENTVTLDVYLENAKEYKLSASTEIKDFIGNSLSSTFSSTFVTGVKDSEGVLYGLVTSPIGTNKVWLDRNLGASQVCTSFDDTLCYGDYYQWGRLRDGHEKSTSSTISIQADSITPLSGDFITNSADWTNIDTDGILRTAQWSTTDGSFCPSGFRVPSSTELFYETTDYDITNSISAFNNFLKLPVSGYRSYSNGYFSNKDSYGYIWSSSDNGSIAKYMYFNSTNASVFSRKRAGAQSVRCIED